MLVFSLEVFQQPEVDRGGESQAHSTVAAHGTVKCFLCGFSGTIEIVTVGALCHEDMTQFYAIKSQISNGQTHIPHDVAIRIYLRVLWCLVREHPAQLMFGIIIADFMTRCYWTTHAGLVKYFVLIQPYLQTQGLCRVRDIYVAGDFNQ